LTLLRFCNKMLQKLGNRSNAENTEFCGTILSFLTHAFPLSERSALNITGKYNVDNLATFESEEEFNELQQQQQMDENKEEEEKHNASSGDADMDLYGDLPSDLSHLPAQHPDRLPIDYNFYKTLWGLQSYLRQPNSILAEDSSTTATATDGFLQSLNVVLEAFEGHPLKKSNDDDATTGAPKQQHAASNHLYLTSSRLLSLQMSDPEIRMHLLTQIIMVLSYLISKTTIVKLKTAFTIVIKKAEDMLGAIPPDGKEMLNLLTYILETREALWTKWKSDGCPPLTTAAIAPSKEVSRDGSNGKSKLLAAPTVEMNDKTMEVDETKTDEIVLLDNKLATGMPKMVDYLEDFVEAMDPESGIEEEYHPKNDKKFCWRALRLMRCNGKIHRLNEVSGDGNIEGVIRAIWGDQNIDLPAPLEPEKGENDEVIPTSEELMEEELMCELTRITTIEDVAMKQVDGDNDGNDESYEDGEKADDEEDSMQKEGEDSKKVVNVEEKSSLNEDSSSTKENNAIEGKNEAKLRTDEDGNGKSVADGASKPSTGKKEKVDESTKPKLDECDSKAKEKTAEIISSKREEDQKAGSSSGPNEIPALYITNIAFEFSTKDLLENLESIGCKGILSINMPPAQGRPRGNDGKAWVMFENDADAAAALKTIERERAMGGRKLKVQESRRRCHPVFPKDAHKTKLRVKNLPLDLMARDFEWEMKALCGRVMSVQLPKSKNGRLNNQGYGFLEFKHPLEAQFAMQKLHRMNFFGDILYAEFAMNQGPPPASKASSASSKNGSDDKTEDENGHSENGNKKSSGTSGDRDKVETTRKEKTSNFGEQSHSEDGEASDGKVDSSHGKKGRSGEKAGDKLSSKADTDVSFSRGRSSNERRNGSGGSSRGSKRDESSRKRQRSPDDEPRDHRRSRRNDSPDRGRDKGRDRERSRDRDATQASKGSDRRRGGDRSSRRRRGCSLFTFASSKVNI